MGVFPQLAASLSHRGTRQGGRERKELSAWKSERNNSCAKVDWQFTTMDARTKLVTLYPEL